MKLPFAKSAWWSGLAALPILYLARRWRNDPQFGGRPRGRYLRGLKASPNWKRGKFRNLDPTPIQEDLRNLLGDLVGHVRAADTQPGRKLPVVESPGPPPDEGHYLTWYGHSSLRIESRGKTILLDPMLGNWVAPIPFLGHRFPYELPPTKLHFDRVDLVVYSHDHYDHLDYDSVKKLIPITQRFLVPLGVGVHLRAWGVDAQRILELDWWQSTVIDGVRYTFAPARHFGGRSPSLRNKSLWGSYAISLDEQTNVYFGGDSGYGRHFKMIGDRLGPFQLSMLDCGQYHERWGGVHMHPEEAIQAHRDLGGGQLLPIHWGGFTLSDHPWDEPIRRVLAADTDHCVLAPALGERFAIGNTEFCAPRWWEDGIPQSAPAK